jgi:RNase P/RNase MRP subunit POP5
MMREKRRYLEFQILSKKTFTDEEAKHLLYEGVFQLLGEKGASIAALQLKAFESKKQLMLVKCSLKSYMQVIAALALKTAFRGTAIALRLRKIYGTLDKAKAVFPALIQQKR